MAYFRLISHHRHCDFQPITNMWEFGTGNVNDKKLAKPTLKSMKLLEHSKTQRHLGVSSLAVAKINTAELEKLFTS